MSLIKGFYVGTTAECLAGIARVDANCGWPKGNTETWSQVLKPVNYEACFPVPQGSHGFTQEEMIEGVEMTIKETVEFMQVDDD